MQCTKLWKTLLKKVGKVDNFLGIIVIRLIWDLLIYFLKIKLFINTKEIILKKKLLSQGSHCLIKIS